MYCDPDCVRGELKCLPCLQPDEVKRRKTPRAVEMRTVWLFQSVMLGDRVCFAVFFLIWQPALNPQHSMSCFSLPRPQLSSADGNQASEPMQRSSPHFNRQNVWQLLMSVASSSVPFINVGQVLLCCRRAPGL